jgi:cell division protease FtsH
LPRSASRRVLLPAALALAALTAIMFPAFGAGAPVAQVPATVLTPLGSANPPAVVPYKQLVGAADARNLNAAVVDTANYWVAAVDGNGRVVAARIPAPRAGTDFGAAPAVTAATAKSAVPGAFDLASRLRDDGVAVIAPAAATSADAGTGGIARYFLIPLGIAVMAAFVIGCIALLRRASARAGQGGGSGRGAAAAHGRIRRNAQVPPPATRFTDVAGCDEAVQELDEVVTFLREPERFARVGARMPRGVILHGPPGTGKTLLAKAVAGEAGVPFFALSGSDFVDTFVGVGAARVRDLFATARKGEKGAIIFFDEIDAIGRARGGGMSGADSEREGTLNQLLVELDGFGERDRVVVMAATNRLDMLDAALLRPGRFDRRVQVGLPAEAGRLAILRLHSSAMPIADPASLAALARVTAGFAGADLSNMVNEAAIMAARAGRDTILPGDLDEGMLRAVAGPEKADRRLAEGELEVIAHHEAGHVLAAELCPTHQKAQRVTILARGDAGGLALYGSEDRALTSQQHLHERMVVAMAGRAAEQISFGVISSGAANDLEQVDRMAREAIERLGFSRRVGQIISSSGPNPTPLSGETRRAIDEEVRRMIDAAYDDAVGLLSDHRDELEALANALLADEQIDRPGIEALLGALARDGHRLPARADALPRPREIPVAAVAEPARTPVPLPEPVLVEPPAERRRVPLRGHRGRRVRAGAEAAAATVFTLALPHLGRRRGRGKGGARLA